MNFVSICKTCILFQNSHRFSCCTYWMSMEANDMTCKELPELKQVYTVYHDAQCCFTMLHLEFLCTFRMGWFPSGSPRREPFSSVVDGWEAVKSSKSGSKISQNLPNFLFHPKVSLSWSGITYITLMVVLSGCRVLDLSAGTGLVGLVAHRHWAWTQSSVDDLTNCLYVLDCFLFWKVFETFVG